MVYIVQHPFALLFSEWNPILFRYPPLSNLPPRKQFCPQLQGGGFDCPKGNSRSLNSGWLRNWHGHDLGIWNAKGCFQGSLGNFPLAFMGALPEMTLFCRR